MGLGDLQWITSAYLLGLTGSLVLAGKLGDLFGRRRIFLIGIASLAYLWRLKFRLKEPILVVATGAIGLLHHGA